VKIALLFICFVSLALSQTCPTGTCTTEETCCQTTEGIWGCCPYTSGVCCSDKVHCCRSKSTCDLEHSRCIDTLSFSALEALSFAKLPQACPTNTCPSTETCCDLSNGAFGCCPYPNADCCTDGAHCCPQDYTCDLTNGECVKSLHNSIEAISKVILPLGELTQQQVDLPQADCPSGTCPSTETCCDVGSGDFGCCPYENAVCCSDNIHCCPNGYTCDVTKGECVKKTDSVNGFSVKYVDILTPYDPNCPDGTCPSGYTCCVIGGGDIACCPYANAMCCSDLAHCCPNGYTCDVEHKECVQKSVFDTVTKVRLEDLIPK